MKNRSKVVVRLLVMSAALVMMATASNTFAHDGHCKATNAGANCCEVENSSAYGASGIQYCAGTDVGGYYTAGNARARFDSGVEARITTQGGTGAVVGKVGCLRPDGSSYLSYTAAIYDPNAPGFKHCFTSNGEVRQGWGCHIESACSY